jgi:hypothetical protein
MGSLATTSSCSSIEDGIGANSVHEMPPNVSPAEAHQMSLNSMAHLLTKQQLRKKQQMQEAGLLPAESDQQGQKGQLQPEVHGRIQQLEQKHKGEQKGASRLLQGMRKHHHKEPPVSLPASVGAGTAAAGLPPVVLSAPEVASTLLKFVVKQTIPYRQLVEERTAKLAAAGASTALNFAPQAKRGDIIQEDEELFLRQLANMPGKLDHATILACQVGLVKGS